MLITSTAPPPSSNFVVTLRPGMAANVLRSCLLRLANLNEETQVLHGGSLRTWARLNMTTAEHDTLVDAGLWRKVQISESDCDDTFEYRHAHLPRYARDHLDGTRLLS
ncbi:MAG: hypothetical protein GY772_08015 [bacterium]|nr:hypothetical protein [bacterium]